MRRESIPEIQIVLQAPSSCRAKRATRSRGGTCVTLTSKLQADGRDPRVADREGQRRDLRHPDVSGADGSGMCLALLATMLIARLALRSSAVRVLLPAMLITRCFLRLSASRCQASCIVGMGQKENVQPSSLAGGTCSRFQVRGASHRRDDGRVSKFPGHGERRSCFYGCRSMNIRSETHICTHRYTFVGRWLMWECLLQSMDWHSARLRSMCGVAQNSTVES